MLVQTANPSTGRQRQEDHKFEASLRNIEKPQLKKQNKKQGLKM
jgi:hypothetical protein